MKENRTALVEMTKSAIFPISQIVIFELFFSYLQFIQFAEKTIIFIFFTSVIIINADNVSILNNWQGNCINSIKPLIKLLK